MGWGGKKTAFTISQPLKPKALKDLSGTTRYQTYWVWSELSDWHNWDLFMTLWLTGVIKLCRGGTQTKPFHPWVWPTKLTSNIPVFTSNHSWLSAQYLSTQAACTPALLPFSHHICLSTLRVKDAKGQADIQTTALRQSRDTDSLCQINGMCLCR